MGIRVLLMGLEKPLGGEGNNSGEMLCAANSFIPLFWLLPFRRSDLKQLPLQDDVAPSYPVLSVSTEVAAARVENFVVLLAEHLESDVLEVLKRWQHYLAQVGYPELALDTYELWAENQAVGDLLNKQLTVLESLLTNDNTEMADVISAFEGVVVKEGRVSGDAISLAGFGW